MIELNENDLIARRKADKREHLLQNSPSLLDRVTSALGKKKAAAQSLEAAEMEEADTLELQRRYNSLHNEHGEIVARLEQVTSYEVSLKKTVKNCQQVILDTLFEFQARPLQQAEFNTIQLHLAEARLQALPLAVKSLKARFAEVKAEMTAIEKGI